jgi:hypothetical protein
VVYFIHKGEEKLASGFYLHTGEEKNDIAHLAAHK